MPRVGFQGWHVVTRKSGFGYSGYFFGALSVSIGETGGHGWDLQTACPKNFYTIRVLPSLSGCTVVAHIVSKVFIAFVASALTVFT